MTAPTSSSTTITRAPHPPARHDTAVAVPAATATNATRAASATSQPVVDRPPPGVARPRHRVVCGREHDHGGCGHPETEPERRDDRAHGEQGHGYSGPVERHERTVHQGDSTTRDAEQQHHPGQHQPGSERHDEGEHRATLAPRDRRHGWRTVLPPHRGLGRSRAGDTRPRSCTIHLLVPLRQRPPMLSGSTPDVQKVTFQPHARAVARVADPNGLARGLLSTI